MIYQLSVESLHCQTLGLSCFISSLYVHSGRTCQSFSSGCISLLCRYGFVFQLNTEWVQIEAIDLTSDGSAWGFGITGGRSTGVVVKTIVPGSVTDKVS
ncbi:multiple PDZ domain protein [Caerostris extrusa]|uniref:Multiple PDZ domain protein n=1 Tax=Caerostris extrusa TaxID=172846 RepID=A0AAV4TR60_CAEEX|nr:multiple PDZ domain protein [Caerostris extrusa]